MLRLALLLALAVSSVSAQPAGTLDPTFGTNGLRSLPGVFPIVVAIQRPSGALVLLTVGEDGTDLVRLRADGAPDASFGTQGRTRLSEELYDPRLAVQADGHILVAATVVTEDGEGVVPVVARFSADGALDTSFGQGGVLALSSPGASFGVAVAGTPDGGFVAATTVFEDDTPALRTVRFKEDGTRDAGFGADGSADLPDGAFITALTTRIVFDPAGRLYVVGSSNSGENGYDPFVVRLTPDGTADASFGNGGVAVQPSPSGFGILFGAAFGPDGLVVGGYESFNGSEATRPARGASAWRPGLRGAEDESGVLAMRFAETGALDPAFGQGGIVAFRGPAGNAFAFDVAVEAGGAVLLGGASGSLLDPSDVGTVFRLDRSGALDASFGDDGAVALAESGGIVMGLALPSPGQIVAVGDAGDGSGFAARLVGGSATVAEPRAGRGALALALAGANPFRGETALALHLDAPGDVTVSLLDVQGRRVAALASGPMAAGDHRVALSGAGLPAGTYVVRAEAGGQTVSARVSVVR